MASLPDVDYVFPHAGLVFAAIAGACDEPDDSMGGGQGEFIFDIYYCAIRFVNLAALNNKHYFSQFLWVRNSQLGPQLQSLSEAAVKLADQGHGHHETDWGGSHCRD